MSVAEELQKLRTALTGSRREAINGREKHLEVPDPTPLELPVGYGGPPSMRELVQTYVEETLSKQAAADDYGTFEEEDDFEAEDEALLDLSGYEVYEYEMEPEGEAPDAAPPTDKAPERPQEAAPETEAAPDKP